MHNTRPHGVAKIEHKVTENLSRLRRQNILALYQEFARARLATDSSAQGLEQAFASSLEVSPSTWSMMKGSRPIGDKLARQVEQHAGKTAGWLDEMHAQAPDAGKERVLELAARAWDASNAKQRRELTFVLKEASTKKRSS
jgi:hypothetical protein